MLFRSNKEVFDAEVFAILRAVRLLDERNKSGREYTIFSDAQAAVARVQYNTIDAGRPRPWPRW